VVPPDTALPVTPIDGEDSKSERTGPTAGAESTAIVKRKSAVVLMKGQFMQGVCLG